MRELSQITGLSTAAVSYALRGQRVSAETVARVRAAADRIGYRSDPIARALRGGRTQLVGVVGGSLDDHWHMEFVAALQRALRVHGLRMVLADAAGDAAEELKLARELAEQRVDGLIVLPIDPLAGEWRAIAAATPTVSVNASLPSPAGAIRFDSDAGVALALGHLRGLGHTSITVLGGGRHRIPRSAGLRRLRCGLASEQARDAFLRAFPKQRPTALFALSDSVAYGVYAGCRDLGLAVPGDLSVVGFDDNPISRLLDPALTAVGWDTPGAAAAAAMMLVDALEGRDAGPQVTVAPRLEVRDSTAAV